MLQGLDAILVPGGFGERGIEGKILAAQYARENNVPYLGICLGLQVAVIDFARHVAKLADAHSTEFKTTCQSPVIGLITEWINAEGEKELRTTQSDLGGTMRLGSQPCLMQAGTIGREVYGVDVIQERHRHRYEVNNNLLPQLEQAGLVVCGRSDDQSLVEMIELPDHPWFLATQHHPEFTSTPRDGHPLFKAFIEATVKYRDSKS